MCKKLLFILLVIHIHNSSCLINDLYQTGTEMWKLYSMIDNIKLNITDEMYGPFYLYIGPKEEIVNQMNIIHEQLQQLERSMNPKKLEDWFKLLSSDILLYRCIDILNLYILSIDDYYREVHEYANRTTYNYNSPSENCIAQLIVNVEGTIGVIRNKISNAEGCAPNERNLVAAITGYANTHSEQFCNGSQPLSTHLIQLFKMLVVAEIKVNTMLVYANLHQSRKRDLEWKQLILLATENFERYFAIYVNLFASNIGLAEPAYLRACDPKDGIWDQNSFYELDGVFQTTIFHYRWASCKHDTCNDVLFNKAYQCAPELYDLRTSCLGSFRQCFYLKAIRACVLKEGPHRFQYLNSSALGPLGTNFECPADNGYIIEDGISGWNINYAACGCNCYGNRNKISLLIMESQVEKNRVITGIRFFRKDRVLFIQPREGKLDANGYVQRNSERWVSIPHHIDTSQVDWINKENRVFFLDDITLGPGFVLTGVGFTKVTNGNVTGFAIKISGLSFNYESGNLNCDRRFSKSVESSHINSWERLSFNATSSVYTTLPHTPSPNSVGYVWLRRSKLREDFGQSTLPLFDAIPIRTNPPSALGGVGIFHKGVEGYAGFLSLRVYGIEYREYFSDFKLAHMIDDTISFNHSQHN